ncbi:hypothetical protein WDZ92_48455 [Nostoc sp. NIES-2111]
MSRQENILRAEIDNLNVEVFALKAEVADLKAELAALKAALEDKITSGALRVQTEIMKSQSQNREISE